MKKIFLFAFIFSALKSYPQTATIDSLKKVLDNYKKEDTLKVELFYKYSEVLSKTDIDGSIKPTYRGIQLAEKLNRLDLAVSGELMLSYIYSKDYKEDSALLIALDGLNTSERLRLNKLLPEFYSQLGETYRMLHNSEQAEDYDNKFLNAAIVQKNDTMILRALLNLLSLYSPTRQSEKIDSLANRALILAADQKDEYSVGRILMVKGREYRLTNLQESINYYRQSLVIWKKIHDYHDMAWIMVLLSASFSAMNNIDSAGWYAYAALDTAKKYHLEKETTDAYSVLFRYHYHLRDYKKALEERLIIDSILEEQDDVQAGQTTMRAEMKYAQEKKDLIASIDQEKKEASARRVKNLEYGILGAFVLLASFLFYNNRQKQRAKINIEKAYSKLKSTQSQLIQSEKMASLGELTAGIAHEIQNPLNFVNNFSEVNKELLMEMKDEMDYGNIDDAKSIANNVIENEEKINHHGKRADAIVKGMLQHSRSSTGVKEPTDINALADEYLRLSYHGLRAKDKEFNAMMKTDFDKANGKINIIPQDIGRVLLNLYNNAFYAVSEKKKQQPDGYEPNVLVTTKKLGDKIEIRVKDNGNGIPQKVVDKIFQPFFTTKPTGVGTGLGLSLSYDIVKAHGGGITVNSKVGEGAEFIIEIPAS